MTTPPLQKWYVRYTLAAAIISAAMLLRLALTPVLGTGAIYIVLSPAVMLVAVSLGMGQGVFGALLGLILVEMLLVPPAHRFVLSASLAVRWFILLVTSGYIGWIGQRLRALQKRSDTDSATAQMAAAKAVDEGKEALVAARRAALSLMEDAIAARERAEQSNLKLHLLQEKEKADAIRLVRAQSAANTIRAMLDGVMLLDLNGTILFVNPAVERLTGLAGREMVDRNIMVLLPSFLGGADLQLAQDGLQALHAGGIPEMMPLALRRPDGTCTYVLPGISLMDAPEEGGRPTAVLTLKDVTDLHETTRLLEESERKYRELVENANSMILRLQPDHTITFFNEFAQEFFGYQAAEVLGRDAIGIIVPEVDSEGHDLRQMMQAMTRQPELYAGHEYENMCKDGRRVWVHWANRAVRDQQGNVREILCIGTDITHRREMEKDARHYQQRLRELAERLAVAEEEDRWRISRYIHDSVIQNLSLSNIRLGSMVKPLRDAALQGELDKLFQIRELLGEAIDECRMVMSDLTPALLYELGLLPALQDLARKLEAKHGVKIRVETDGCETPVSHTLRGMLFESVREMIMNALKHAGSCEIRVSVSCSATDLVIRVVDNGQGFSASTAAKTPRQGGFGLLNIRQRLDGLGGKLELESIIGQGTTATIRVPLEVAMGH